MTKIIALEYFEGKNFLRGIILIDEIFTTKTVSLRIASLKVFIVSKSRGIEIRIVYT